MFMKKVKKIKLVLFSILASLFTMNIAMAHSVTISYYKGLSPENLTLHCGNVSFPSSPQLKPGRTHTFEQSPSLLIPGPDPRKLQWTCNINSKLFMSRVYSAIINRNGDATLDSWENANIKVSFTGIIHTSDGRQKLIVKFEVNGQPVKPSIVLINNL